MILEMKGNLHVSGGIIGQTFSQIFKEISSLITFLKIETGEAIDNFLAFCVIQDL